MKKYILSFTLLCFIAIQSHSQKLTDPNLTFYGVDFTKARMLGGGFNDPVAIKTNLFDSWNGFFRTEPDKYDVEDAFKKKVTLDFDNVERHNKLVDANALITNNDYTITPGEAESVIKDYDTKGKTGLGCAFVVESFDKSKAAATIYVIFFDMATHRVILNKKMEGEAGGFGLKNYWANAIRLVLFYSKKEFPKWVKGK